MPGYKARIIALKHQALDAGVPDTPRGVAEYCGIPRSTAWRMLNGCPVSAATMRAVLEAFHAPLDELFEAAGAVPPPVRRLRTAGK